MERAEERTQAGGTRERGMERAEERTQAEGTREIDGESGRGKDTGRGNPGK